MKRFSLFLLVAFTLVFISGCLGMTGTRITGKIPVLNENGKLITTLDFDYQTDDSKELSGLSVRKTSDGGWEFVLDKSSSTPNNVMAEALLELTKKFPDVISPLK